MTLKREENSLSDWRRITNLILLHLKTGTGGGPKYCNQKYDLITMVIPYIYIQHGYMVLSYHGMSIMRALKDLFPEVKWENSVHKNKQHKQRMANIIYYMIRINFAFRASVWNVE
jgi:hypothetical protein